MPKITIDGKVFDAAADASVLDVARANDIWIPTLCHHEALSDYGACRLCLVETVKKGRSRVTTSCTLPAQEGMTIVTASERLDKLRRLVMELILASCPRSKAVLDMAKKLGARSDRLEPDPAGDCIRCGLCVRACAEISGAEAINFARRGVNRTIAPPFGTPSSDCVLCGACVFVCPTGSRLLDLAKISGEEPQQLLSRFDAQLARRGAIARPFPQALPNVPAIDRAACLHLNRDKCGICEKVCEAKAIRFDDQDREEEIDVGAVIVAPGFEEFQPHENYDTGYSRFPDVVTSMEFERILSASGPFGGHVVRPSDGKEPRKIAFLQCVGSRDVSCRGAYCSSVCCMYAIKESVIAKEHCKGIEATVFFMDMRAFGKDFDKYYERAKSEYGVRFVRARVSDIAQRDSRLTVQYSPDAGGVQVDEFDMVVLSVGLKPSAGVRELAARLGVRRDADGFVWTDPAKVLHTSRPGVFVGGPASQPMDIPETVVQASGAACEASRLLADARDTLTVEQKFPPERDITSDPPRIGVFVCHCGINIGGVVNVPGVAEYAMSLPYVVHSEHNLYTCSQDAQDHVRDVILEKGINRVVIASCSPRTHEPLFQHTLRQAGLNPHLFAMANIRDQCSWAHMREPGAATEKARDLVRMTVAKAALTVPLRVSRVPVVRQALVVGGGAAGMTAALAIAEQGYKVCLVEREAALGGNLRDMYAGFDGQDLAAARMDLAKRTESHPNITVKTETTVSEVHGFVGNFLSKLSNGEEYPHGVAVIATGASEYLPKEYGFGEDPRVITQRQLSRLLAASDGFANSPRRVVMIQCVGSRNTEHPYCSRVCCTRAVVNAAALKRRYPHADVCVLYRDIRTYGVQERYYRQAREAGVVFIRFDEATPPTAVPGRSLRVQVRDPITGSDLNLETDLVVLSAGIAANEDENDRLAKLFKIPMNDDGFFLEAHAKLRPVEFATEGVYVAGLAHAPKNLNESMAQALAAASRAGTVLAQSEIETSATIAEVIPERCVACGLCEAVCAYAAATLELQRIGKQERVFARINPALCKGCGACAAGCRSGALALLGFTDKQILAEIGQL